MNGAQRISDLQVQHVLNVTSLCASPQTLQVDSTSHLTADSRAVNDSLRRLSARRASICFVIKIYICEKDATHNGYRVTALPEKHQCPPTVNISTDDGLCRVVLSPSRYVRPLSSTRR